MRSRVPVALSVVSLALAQALLAPTARADTFAPGSLIVPMDTTYQDSGMLKAYGLVYSLLKSSVPVRWVIRQGKAFQSADFTTSATDHKSGAAITSHGYRGGPFVIDSADAAKAIPIINAWQAANPQVAVHHVTASFSGDVARYLVVAPKVAMHADGNQGIAVGYLNAAGIPDSQGNPWPASSPDLLTPVAVAGPTTTNHHDGALFDADGDPVYCQFMSMHWAVTDAQKAPEVVAEVRQFLTNPVHFFAECQAVDAFENLIPYGHFLTPNGYAIKSQPSSVDFYHADVTFAQIDGAFKTVGGSEPGFALPPGDAYKAGGVTMITAHGFPEGQWDLWMTGFLDGSCPPGVEVCGTLGKVSYLAGHQYKVSLPISNNPDTQGVRLFLNSLFDSTCASAGGQPFIYLVKSAPDTTASGTVTFTLNYDNAGPTVALAAVLSDPIPPGSTFVSATNGGTFSGGKVTWNLGNLGVGETGLVSFTVNLGAHGIYQNTATLAYQVGLNPFTLPSNTTSTIFDVDTDGDGIFDLLDDCPNNPDPMQNLSVDAANCGACGHACSVSGGTPMCSAGQCGIAACDSGLSDCNGAYADGCEVDDATFAVDPNNCGGCGIKCSFQHAGASCVSGACKLGACSAGYSDCNGLPGDGCEYADAGFQTDPNHCGGCAKKCAAGFVCTGGACVVSSCPAGFSDCDGSPGNGCEYANLGFQTDANNCGSCGIKCSPPNGTGLCSGGVCAVASCNAGFSDCNGLPADGCELDNASFQTSLNNCGGCGIACAPTNAVGACQGGACAIATCQPGFSDCNGSPTDGCEYPNADLATDPNNCGGCGLACSFANANAACVGGMCAIATCKAGFVDLDGNPANGCEYGCVKTAVTDATCDGVDDDCDGQIDEEYAPTSCGVGACAATSRCVLGVESCTPGFPSVEGPQGSASCSDGVDNDCDGFTDGADSDCQVAGCQSAADCDDGDPCTSDSCVNAFCVHAGVVCDAGPGTGGAGGATGSTTSSTTGAGGTTGSTTGAGGTTGSTTGAGGTTGSTTGAGGTTGSTTSTTTGAGGSTGSTTSTSGGGETGATSSTGASSSSSGSSGENAPGDQGSCACRAAPSGEMPTSVLAIASLGLLAAGRRRRRSSAGVRVA